MFGFYAFGEAEFGLFEPIAASSPPGGGGTDHGHNMRTKLRP